MSTAMIAKRKTVKMRNLRCALMVVICWAPVINSSEFPERECCDLTTTTTVGPIPIPPAMPTTKFSPTSSPQAIPTGRSGSNIKTAIAILNCILARQLCFEDPSCSAILEIIPRVCGPIPVACSTVTVTKCQAALRTLQAFPFFRPTCLCKEPGVDPECNNFRDFLFDHPCGFVLKKEKDPFPVDALPTCNHALSVCQHERICNKVYEDFKAHCKVRDSKCRMDDRDSCHESWASLRMSPMFGCICPNNHMKRRCDRIFSIVNHNPCIDAISKPFPGSYGIPTNSLHPRPNKFDKVPRFPHFLFPSHKIPLALASHRPATDVYIHPSSSSNSIKKLIYNVANGNRTSNNYSYLDEHVFSTFVENNSTYKHNSRNDFVLHQHQSFAPIQHNKSSDRLHHRRISHHREDHNSSEIVRKIGMDVNYHESISDGSMELVQTPLTAPSYTHYFRHRKVILYPYNITAFQASISPTDSVLINYTDKRSAQDVFMDNSSDVQLNFQSTCHIALDACRDDALCAASLQPMLLHCELHSCDRDACMMALQAFYRGPHEDLSVDIAFCLCRKSSNRHDVCMLAQEKLHPQCAQRPPENFSPSSSNGVAYQPPPACHLVADLCKEDTNCRIKLERFEQACAIDSITKKCAGRTNNCRSALLGILGTQLRMTCACHGIEFTHLYECLGWQRLLWLNPCIVEAQKDFHIKRFAELGVVITKTVSTASSVPNDFKTTSVVSSRVTYETNISYPVELPIPKSTLPSTKQVGLLDIYSEPDSEEQNSIGRTDSLSEGVDAQTVTTMTTSMLELETVTHFSTSSTVVTSKPQKIRQNCAVQRPHQPDQLVPEGSSRRIYSLDDTECSELCTCGDSLTLICHALCVPFAPCRTPLAYYNHASPAYQAFRGRCVCYSGHFICMRPPPGEYYLPGGVFLLLGYSSTDEALLRPHTNLGVQDAVRALQQYILAEIDNKTSCLLTLFNITEENIIVSAKLPSVSKFEPSQMLQEEKEQCASILETVSHHINSEHSELQAHRLLSIFKMSEVQIVSPEKSASATLSIFVSIAHTYFLSFSQIFLAKFIGVTT